MGEYRVHWETRLSILPLFDVTSFPFKRNSLVLME